MLFEFLSRIQAVRYYNFDFFKNIKLFKKYGQRNKVLNIIDVQNVC